MVLVSLNQETDQNHRDGTNEETEKDWIRFQWDHISPSVNTTNHMSSTKMSRIFMDRPRASIVFASQQHCKSCISDPSQVKLSLAISTAAAVGFTHKCFVVSEWVHAAAWALTNTRLQVSSLVYPVLHYETLLRIWVLVYFDPKSKLF